MYHWLTCQSENKMKTYFNQQFAVISLIMAFSIVMINCQELKEQSKTKKPEKAYKENTDQIKADIAKAIEDMPLPSIIPNTLKKTGTPYHPELIHDMSLIESYLNDDDKAALNLGIYAADIAYLITYDQVHQSLEHLAACQKLSEYLGVTAAFDLETMQRYEQNMDKHDTLITLMNETIIEAQNTLNSSERITMAALVLTGSFIEGMYTAVKSIEYFPKTNLSTAERVALLEPITELIIAQEKPLLDLIKLLKDLPQDEAIANVTVELEVLERLYQSDLEDIKTLMNQNENTVVTPEMLQDINYEVLRIRKKITN